jgi:rod shape-determining protein MreD
MPPSLGRQILNWLGTFASALLSLVALAAPLPAWQLGGVGVDWPLLWVVCWSIRRTALRAAWAGLALGWAVDGLTSSPPTHALGLALAGVLTARLEKQRYIQEDFISVAVITFAMAVLAETCLALQHMVAGKLPLGEVWSHHQWVALGSALVSSLWAPLVYVPLRWWWRERPPETP